MTTPAPSIFCKGLHLGSRFLQIVGTWIAWAPLSFSVWLLALGEFTPSYILHIYMCVQDLFIRGVIYLAENILS